MTSDLLTAAMVSALLGVDASTVYRMAADGRLPAVKVGRQWRFPRAQIDGLLATGIPVAPVSAAAPPPAARPAALPSDVAECVVALVAEALGVMMLVTDMQGRPVTPVLNPCGWFAEHGADDDVLGVCIDEWRRLAGDLTFTPAFRMSQHGFRCARAFIRSGNELIGMVLAGGLAPEGVPVADDGLYHLPLDTQARVLALLPKVAAALSSIAGHPAGADNGAAVLDFLPTVHATA